MEVSKTSFNELAKLVTQFMKDDSLELEIKHIGGVSRLQFSRLISALRQQRGLKEVHHPESLDIFFNYTERILRLTLQSKDVIQEYCRTNIITPHMVHALITKQQVPSARSVFFNDYSFKADLKSELQIHPSNDLLELVATAAKGYRYKQRFSFEGANVRFDLTVVKSSYPHTPFVSHMSFAKSGVVTAPEKFEVEVELINRRGHASDLAHILVHAGIQSHIAISGTAHVVTKQEEDVALYNYMTLWKHEDTQRPLFIGPQPVTLELQNITQDGVADQTILSNYTVTEKADGERCLLYVGNDGKCWFISSTLKPSFTGVTAKDIKNTIVDGELVLKDARGQSCKIYAMFDMYVINGKDIRALPLLGKVSRVDHLLKFEQQCKPAFASQANMTVFCKNFFEGDIFAQSKRLLDMSKAEVFPYRIDGLIFTPSKLPVGGLFEGDIPAHGTWQKVFKWKPPQENTIDFCVRRANDERIAVDGKMYKVFHLYVGYRPSAWEPIKPKQVLTGKWQAPSKAYGMKLFTPVDVVSNTISMFYGETQTGDIVVCKNGDVIQHDSIVEFAYEENGKDYQYRWTPLRVRKDKTSPNDFSTAMNVWRSIGFPVTESLISGESKVNTDDIPPVEVYYKRLASRDKFISKNMMQFHNQGVKHNLITKYADGAHSLFDIACGKIGDLNKWLKNKIAVVYGIDKSRDNIENPVDGAYHRLMDTPEAKQYKYIFGAMDASQEITKEYVQSLDEDSRYVGELLLKHPKFDVISCQFAVHYFFENDTTLDNFVKNVARFLKPGGYFIGTCLDGSTVRNALERSPVLTGAKDGRLVWQIKKVSDTTIKVYMESINNEIKEYLVDFDVLSAKLAAYDIVPIEIKSFKDIYETIMQTPSMQTHYYVKAMKDMTDVEKQYSFMNTTFVYQKRNPQEETRVSDVSESMPVAVPALQDQVVIPQKKKIVKKITTKTDEQPVPVVPKQELEPASQPMPVKKKIIKKLPQQTPTQNSSENIKTIDVPNEALVAPLEPEEQAPPAPKKKVIVKKKQV